MVRHILDVGGYNEFNQETGSIKIFRWGFQARTAGLKLTARWQMCRLCAWKSKKV